MRIDISDKKTGKNIQDIHIKLKAKFGSKFDGVTFFENKAHVDFFENVNEQEVKNELL